MKWRMVIGSLVACMMVVFVPYSVAGTYWVSPTGAASWGSCSGSTPLSGTSACSLSTANSNATAGDTVYLRGGTYEITATGIIPSRSGSATQPITFSGYASETVTLHGKSDSSGKGSKGASLSSVTYIKITKINFTNMYLGLTIIGGGYNEISYCTFTFRDAWASGEQGVYSYSPAGIDIDYNSTHNWIHHNIMHGLGGFSSNDEGVLFAIGNTVNDHHYVNSNNTIENNHIYHGGHHVFSVNSGYYNVIKNNYIHNEGWFSDALYSGNCAAGDNGVCGYRIISSIGDKDHVGRTLYEGNAIAYGAQYGGPHADYAHGGSGNAMNLSNSNNILRYNSFFGNVMYGLSFASSMSGTSGSDNLGWSIGWGNYNKVYNNTFFSNGWNWSSYGIVHEDDPLTLYDSYRTGISFGDNSNITGNVIKNNLFYKNWSLTHYWKGTTYYPDIYAWSAANVSNNTISNNYTSNQTYLASNSPFADTSNPLFVDPDISTPLGTSVYNNYALLKPDLRLQSTSPAKDAGTHLTTAVGSGSSSTSLTVADAAYFQDGTWGSYLAQAAGAMKADWIAVGSVTNASQISSINYSSNVITLSSPLTWTNGAKVWLYKKADGERILYGKAPDMGAYEIILRDPPPNFRKTAQ